MNSLVTYLIWFAIGLIIGYLDPVVIFRKFNALMEKRVFPFLTELRKKWRQKPIEVKLDEQPSSTAPIQSDETEDINP